MSENKELKAAFAKAEKEALKQIAALKAKVLSKNGAANWGKVGDLNHIAAVIRDYFTEVK